MKTILATFLALLISSQLFSQQRRVDIRITSLTATNCQITLYPSFSEFNTFSNVVFTLRWRAVRNITVGDPAVNNQMPIARSGPVRTNGSWKYQVYAGIALQAGMIGQPLVFNIPRSGSGDIKIAVDSYVNQITVNGAYYASVGGVDVTGAVLTAPRTTTSAQPASPKALVKPTQSLPTLYYQPSTRQYLIKYEGDFYTMLGQKTMIFNTEELILVRTRELQ